MFRCKGRDGNIYEISVFYGFRLFKLFCKLPVTIISVHLRIDHFTVVVLVTWPLNGSEAGSDLVLIQTSMLLLCKSSCSYAN